MSAQVTTVAWSQQTAPVELRHDWKRGEVAEIYRTPLTELVFRSRQGDALRIAHTARRALTMTRP
jgi:hypothetical protein